MASTAIRARARSYPLAVRSVRPVVIRTTKVVKHKHRRGKHTRHGGLQSIMDMAIAGLALGLLDKSSLMDSLPKLPFLNEHGSIAAYAWAADRYLHVGGKWSRRLAEFAAGLSAYEMGHEGEITGYIAGGMEP